MCSFLADPLNIPIDSCKVRQKYSRPKCKGEKGAQGNKKENNRKNEGKQLVLHGTLRYMQEYSFGYVEKTIR